MNIYTGGVNAVGKSSLLKKVAEQTNYTYIHATSHLMKSFGFDSDYEKLRSLTQDQRDEHLAKCMTDLVQNNPEENFLVDGHYLALVKGTTNKVTGNWIKNFDALVLVTADTQDVWERIIKDSPERDRALFPDNFTESQKIEMLKKFQQDSFDEFKSISKTFNIPSIEIKNKKDLQEEAVQNLILFLEKLRD